jgi:hypothetical protein
MEIEAKIRLRTRIFPLCPHGEAARRPGMGAFFLISALDWPSAIGVAQAIIANGTKVGNG